LLRQKAEERLKKQQSNASLLTDETDILKLFHELQVHQIELEMQNEELVIAKEKIEELAKEKYKELYDFAPSGYVSLTKDGKITELNFAAAKMLGTERSRLINKRFDFLVSVNTQPTFNLFFQNIFSGKTKQTCEVTMATEGNRTAAGQVLPLYVGIVGIVNNNDEMCDLTLVDITETKLAENKIKEAKLEAEQANLAKSEFLSRMSHELRTPMNSILGFAQLMDMGELAPAHKKAVAQILKSGKHLLGLINEVLDLSKIETGKLSISLESVSICNLISETLDIVNPLANDRNVSLELINLPNEELIVRADNQKLKQVLLNLINNAVKYNRDGGSVKVMCSKEKGVGSKENGVGSKENGVGSKEYGVRISVVDTGNGIAPEELHKLFNPFQRIGAEISEIEGTGLGLAVAKKLIEAMHGKIGVESKVGVGSTFWIELPQAEGKTERQGRVNDLSAPEKEKTVVTGTILYIEDNLSNIHLVAQILQEHRSGLKLISEMYGRNAVKLATDYKPALILLDLDLPDIHGSAVLKRLKENKLAKSIPVVVLSADAMGHQMERLIKAGANGYITKPLDVVEFLKVIDGYFGKK